MTDSDPAAIISEALAHHQAGRLDDAEAGYTEILSRDADNIDAQHLLSALRLQQGRPQEALDLAERVIRLNPNVADAHSNMGTALQAMERYGEAAFAFRRAIDLAPDAPQHRYNLGNALRASDDKTGAVQAYRDAVRLAPELMQAHSNLGATLSEIGLFDEAAAHCRIAVKLAPAFADGHYNLGNALRESGNLTDAVAAYHDAIRHNADHADAHCNLALSLMVDAGLDTAISEFSEALRANPEHTMAQFYQAVALEMSGANADPALDALPEDDPNVAAWLDSWTYVKSNSDLQTEIIHDPFQILNLGLQAATLDGLALEFGVRHGASIRHIAARAGQWVDGFDSFHGLPSAWGGEPRGVYSTSGHQPDVPQNVRLHAGLFEETIGPFLEQNPGAIRFCNIDCDLYGSTVTVLEGLAPRIQPGSILVFDEYLVNPTWRDDEFRAFQEAVERYNWRYRYLAFGIVTKQAAVIIEDA